MKMRRKKMRIKEKLFCDECGTFIRETTPNENDEIKKDRLEGTRTSLDIICRKCLVKDVMEAKMKSSHLINNDNHKQT
jgi:hypothetical protein